MNTVCSLGLKAMARGTEKCYAKTMPCNECGVTGVLVDAVYVTPAFRLRLVPSRSPMSNIVYSDMLAASSKGRDCFNTVGSLQLGRDYNMLSISAPRGSACPS